MGTSGHVSFGVTKCVWCCVLLLFLSLTFRIDGVDADSSSNSSSVVSTNDGTNDDDAESTVEKGMRPFFDMVVNFLEVIQPNKLTEQTWLNLSNIVEDGKFRTDEFSDWQDWAKYLVGFMVLAAVGIVFFLAMPIAGLVFCCCRLCGKCGGKPKAQDPKRAGCKRKTFCTLLLVINTVLLAGVVCTFLSNQILFDKLRNENDAGPIGKLTYSVDQATHFANTTVSDIKVAVLDRFVDIAGATINNIKDTVGLAIEAVLDSLNTTSLLTMSKALSANVSKTSTKLNDAVRELDKLQMYGSWLEGNLSAIKASLPTSCTVATCGVNLTDLDISANFSTLTALDTELSNVNKAANLTEDINQVEVKIADTKNKTTQSINTEVDKAQTSVNSIEAEIQKAVDNITEQVTDAVTDTLGNFRSDLQDAQDNISEYSKYVWYAGLGISSVLCLVVALYYLGILFGLCGERPGEGAQCCNTGAGANFLMAGVGITFLLSWLIMLVCLILFVIGGPMYTELCRYFVDHNPQTLKPFNEAVMEAADLRNNLYDGKDVTLDLVDILEGCKNNSAIYTVLRLDNMVNISEYANLDELNRSLDELENETLNIANVTLLTPELNQSISEFANSGLDGIDFERYKNETSKDLTVGDLPAMASRLRNAAAQATQPLNATLADAAQKLDDLQRDVVEPMKQSVTALNTALSEVEDQAKSGFKTTTDNLLQGLRTAEDTFNNEKNGKVKTQMTEVVSDLKTTVQNRVQGMLNDVYDNVAKCRPVYNSFYAATDAVCVAALEPLNAFWFSIGWCLFFFVPALIFAILLAGLYRRSEKRDRDFDDPNFSLYQEGKQDGVPLTRQQQQPGRSGMVNSGYQAETSFSSDYPGYKGGALNQGYQPDHYPQHLDKHPGPPPYGYPNGSVAMNGNGRGRDNSMPLY